MKAATFVSENRFVVITLTLLTLVLPPLIHAQGQWTTLPYPMKINPIHAALLRTGKVLVVAGSGNYTPTTNYQAAIWDPKAGTISVQSISWDMFCNGMVVRPDGIAFVLGGTKQYDPFHGLPYTAGYDPSTGLFVNKPSMAHGRWYPTATVLGNGTIMVFSGLNETGGTNTAVEIYTVGVGWSTQYSAGWTPPLYPRLHLLPNGKVFYSGSTSPSRTFNPSTLTWTTGPSFTYSPRTYGSSVLLPLTPKNNYRPKVLIMGGGNPATNTAETIDLGASSPTWTPTANNMTAGRTEMNAVILPSGKVLAVGGSVDDEKASTATLAADLYDPATNMFGSAGKEAYPRLYHSIALLLPDATVAVTGGNPSRGSYESHIEIYKPAYLFTSTGSLAARPTISSAPSSIGYGSSFQVSTAAASSISSVVLMRNGAVTHAFNMDQRMVGLTFTIGSGVLNVTGPPNGNIAPPGYYMLFLINNSGVPSVATFVQVK